MPKNTYKAATGFKYSYINVMWKIKGINSQLNFSETSSGNFVMVGADVLPKILIIMI
jgi:hypothetical protein